MTTESKEQYRMGIFLIFAAIMTAVMLPATTARGEPAPPGVTFLPAWIPQAQFAGYYMALDKGFYRQRGLDVVILDGGPGARVDKLLPSGAAMFATLPLAEVLKLRDSGAPVVHLAQVSQRSALMLVARKSRGVLSLKDLEGKKAAVWDAFSTQPLALFKRNNLNVKVVPQGTTVNLFLRGGVDAISAMWYNEYHLILNSGLDEEDLTTVFFDRNGLNFPEDCIICMQDLALKRPGSCSSFVKATFEGWDYAAHHKDEALNAVLKRTEKAKAPTNRNHQRWMLDRMCELITPAKAGTATGELAVEDFRRVADELKSGGQIKSAPAFEEFHAQTAP